MGPKSENEARPWRNQQQGQQWNAQQQKFYEAFPPHNPEQQQQAMQYYQQMQMYQLYMHQRAQGYGDESAIAAYGSAALQPQQTQQGGKQHNGTQSKSERHQPYDRKHISQANNAPNHNFNNKNRKQQEHRFPRNVKFDPSFPRLSPDPNLRCDNCDKTFTKIATVNLKSKFSWKRTQKLI